MKRRVFTREFKVEAVRLLDEGLKPPAQIARELDIPRNKLHKWKEELRENAQAAFPGRGRGRANRTELEKLKVENARLREEVEILKKAAKFFARESG